MATNKQVFAFTNVDLGVAQPCVGAGNSRVFVSCLSFESMSIHGATVGTTAWSSAVVTVKVSNSINGPWHTIPGGSVTLTAAGLTPLIDVSAFAYLALETTTAQSGAFADFWICGQGRK